MKLSTAYQSRPVRFLEVIRLQNWDIKLYSISVKNEIVSGENIELAKSELENWLKNSSLHPLDTYKVAVLIIHEGREGCFAVISWWVDENMLQTFVYLRREGDTQFRLFSDSGIWTCVWELAVIWHERNAWVNHILKKPEKPDREAYLADHLNQPI